jgi:cytochrome c oxidase cbb3-type subunit III
MAVENKEYDGIRYNPQDSPPLIFNLLYYGLWVWGLCFMGYFLFSGWSSHGEYAAVKRAKEARLATEKLEGKEEFGKRCVSCHGQNAKGGIGPDLTRKGFKYGRSAPEVTRSITEGRPGGMPPFKNELPPDKIDGLVQYVLSL